MASSSTTRGCMQRLIRSVGTPRRAFLSNDSNEAYKGIEADHQTSNFDKWVLSKFGPKGRYASSAEVPSYVRKMEMDNAKSRGRIVLNLLMMAVTLAASFYLLGVGRVRRDAGQTLSNRNMEMHKSWSQEGKQDASKN